MNLNGDNLKLIARASFIDIESIIAYTKVSVE